MLRRILKIIIILAVFMTSCAMHTIPNGTDSDHILIRPAVVFKEASTQVSPDNVAFIVVTVTFQNDTIQQTFDYEKGSGTLSTLIPINTQFTLTIQGVDGDGKVIYSGVQIFSGASTDTTITITASQVTPWTPENLTVKALDSTTIQLTWEDKSSNENGFIIKRSANNDSSYIVLDTVAADQQTVTDNASINPLTVYYYMIMAYNAAGNSDSISTKYDPLAVVQTPAKPQGDTHIPKETVFFFQTDSIACGNGHLVQYRFDWGDNSMSDWMFTSTAYHSWSEQGVYTIKVQARCSVYPDVVSAWSEGLEITVTNNVTEKVQK